MRELFMTLVVRRKADMEEDFRMLSGLSGVAGTAGKDARSRYMHLLKKAFNTHKHALSSIYVGDGRSGGLDTPQKLAVKILRALLKRGEPNESIS